MEAIEHLHKGLEGCGYRLVHTWRNGQHTDWIYERPDMRGIDAMCIYSHDSGSRVGIRNEQSTGSYLLAEEIKNNPEYIDIDQDMSVCCTSGTHTYYHEGRDTFYTIFSAAGHGSVASEVPSKDVTARMKAAWARIEQNIIENAEKAAWGNGGP